MKGIINRKLGVCLLSLVLVFAFSSFAFADGWIDNVEKIELDTTYQGFRAKDTYEAYSFDVPAKGTITIHIESSNPYAVNTGNFISDYRHIYKSSDVDNEIESFLFSKNYSSARDVYYADHTLSLNKGTYYLVSSAYSTEGEYEFSVNYKANISSTKITKLTAKKGGFKAQWKKSAHADGYEIKYSVNKNMSKAKVLKTTNTYKTIKNLKKGKNYYIKVRAYRKVVVDGNKNTYYSKWSGRKVIKTKK